MGGEAGGNGAAGRVVMDNRWAVSEVGVFVGDEEDDDDGGGVVPVE